MIPEAPHPTEGFPMADRIWLGGTVWTGAEGHRPARALAAEDGRVVAVGGEEEVSALAGPDTVVEHLEGRTVLPGFVDAHAHVISAGHALSRVQLRDADSPEELAHRLESWADRLPEGRWITGGGWDHELWGGALPDRSWIDPVTPGHPVLVHRLDLHMALANTVALQRAGIDGATPDPDGGRIERDGSGRPTGLLRDRAVDLVSRLVPPPGPGDRASSLQAAARHALSLGVTQLHDMGVVERPEEAWANLATYREALEREALPLRIYAFVPIEDRARLSDWVAEHGPGGERLWWGGVKGFVDGSLGSGTAWMHEPFDDEAGNCGLPLGDLEELRQAILDADQRGHQVAVHAIGDRANDWLLDVYREVGEAHGPRDRRLRVEHAQHLSPGAAERFGALGVVASTQPYHLSDDGRWAERRLGEARASRAWALASLLRGGVRLAFGSDWPVAPPDPILAVASAVSRRTLDEKDGGGWIPAERLERETALSAHTLGGAWAGRAEARTGRLLPGTRADLVVLDQDLFALAPRDLGRARVDQTVVDGEVAWRREG